MFSSPLLPGGVFPGAVFGGYFELAEEERELEVTEAELAEGLVVASLFGRLECLCADGSWEWPPSLEEPRQTPR